jgi:hypothetical protein
MESGANARLWLALCLAPCVTLLHNWSRGKSFNVMTVSLAWLFPSSHKQTLGKEERISFRILPLRRGQTLVWFVFFPDARGENVLVTLIPPSVNYLGQRRVVVEAFKFFICHSTFVLFGLAGSLQGVEAFRICFSRTYRSRFCGLRRVVKHKPIKTSDSVEEEVVDIVVLQMSTSMAVKTKFCSNVRVAESLHLSPTSGRLH